MTVAIDTNILFDILLPDPVFLNSSYSILTRYIKTDRLIISGIVYSELASQFSSKSEMNSFLDDTNIKLSHSSSDALWVASKAWKKYTDGRDNKSVQCAKCGNKEQINCSYCSSAISGRQHIISDFLIAGHALTEASLLLTRDRGFYRTYFPELKTESGL